MRSSLQMTTVRLLLCIMRIAIGGGVSCDVDCYYLKLVMLLLLLLSLNGMDRQRRDDDGKMVKPP